MAQHAWPATEPTEVVAGRGRRPPGRRPARRRAAPARRRRLGRARRLPAGAVPAGLARRRARCPGPTGCATGAGPGTAGSCSSTSHSPGQPNAMHGLVAWQPWQRARPAADRGHASAPSLEPHSGLSVPARPSPSTTCSAPDRLDGHRAGAQRRHRRRRRSASACTPTCTSGRTRTAASAAPSSTVPARTAAGDRRRAAHRGAAPVPRRRRPDRRTGPSTPRSPTWSATTTAGPGCGCAARRASSSSPSTSRGRGCRSTPATRCRRASGGAAWPSSR